MPSPVTLGHRMLTSCARTSHTQGTYAKVKYGQHVDTGEAVAIKVCQAGGCATSSFVTRAPSALGP